MLRFAAHVAAPEIRGLCLVFRRIIYCAIRGVLALPPITKLFVYKAALQGCLALPPNHESIIGPQNLETCKLQKEEGEASYEETLVIWQLMANSVSLMSMMTRVA